MTETRKPRPRDPIALAKLIGDIATGQTEDQEGGGKDTVRAVAGKKGGKARARALSSSERSEIASIAAQARWKKAN